VRSVTDFYGWDSRSGTPTATRWSCSRRSDPPTDRLLMPVRRRQEAISVGLKVKVSPRSR
jgi:hypothetical protein